MCDFPFYQSNILTQYLYFYSWMTFGDCSQHSKRQNRSVASGLFNGYYFIIRIININTNLPSFIPVDKQQRALSQPSWLGKR